MKITIICDGAADDESLVVAGSLCRGLIKRGHEAAVVCSDKTKKDREDYIMLSLPSRRSRDRSGYSGMALSREDKTRMESVIWDSDAVYIMQPYALGYEALKLCFRHRIPVAAAMVMPADSMASRIFGLDGGAVSRLLYRRLYRRFYRYADAVHYPNQLIREIFEKAVGHTTDGFVIHRGVGERFQPKAVEKPRAFAGRFVILDVGEYRREMNHDLLIDAVALSKHQSEIQLIFSGKGAQKAALKQRAAKLAHMPVFASFPHSQLHCVMNYADLYVHPATVDLLPDACMEALACGMVPLIADSPQNAARMFALDEHSLFACDDPRELAEKIDRFFEHPEMIEEDRRRYKGIAAELTWDVYLDRMEIMLGELRG